MNGCKKQLFIPKLTLSETDKAYLAGLIDGEGCIHLQRNQSKKSPNYNYTATMFVGNTNAVIIDICKELNLGYIDYRKQINIKHKKAFVWRLTSNPCRALLPLILPYLRIKKQQSELLLEYLNLVAKANVRSFRSEYLKKVDEIYCKIKALNKKGPN